MKPPHVPAQPEPHGAIEMHHRIANNLALIAAIVELDGRTVTDRQAASVLAATQLRIQAVANVHRRMYLAPNQDSVNLGIFLSELGESLRTIITDDRDCRTITVRVDDFDLPNSQAAAFAILVTELVGNACKHAYRVDVPGEVRVVFDVRPSGDWLLCVEDDGVGIGHNGGGAQGLGSHIIDAVSHQLGGKHRWETGNPGTRFLMWSDVQPSIDAVPIVVRPPARDASQPSSRRHLSE